MQPKNGINRDHLFQMKEYELSEVFHHEEDSDHFEVIRGEPLMHNEISGSLHNTDIELQIEEERQQEEMRRFTRSSTSTTTFEIDPNAIVPTTSSPPHLAYPFSSSSAAKKAVLNNIVHIYNHNSTSPHPLYIHKLRRTMRKYRKYLPTHPYAYTNQINLKFWVWWSFLIALTSYDYFCITYLGKNLLLPAVLWLGSIFTFVIYTCIITIYTRLYYQNDFSLHIISQSTYSKAKNKMINRQYSRVPTYNS